MNYRNLTIKSDNSHHLSVFGKLKPYPSPVTPRLNNPPHMYTCTLPQEICPTELRCLKKPVKCLTALSVKSLSAGFLPVAWGRCLNGLMSPEPDSWRRCGATGPISASRLAALRHLKTSTCIYIQ
jgi:hypothetical protein